MSVRATSMTDTVQTDLAARLMDRLSSMRASRSPWEGLWQEIADYVMPRRTVGLSGALSPTSGREGRLFDTTAVQANITLANGCLAWMSPQESPWFAFDSPVDDAGDDALTWLSRCSERTRQGLVVSNFYTSVHEFYLDRSAFGTACLYVEPGRKGALNVQCWPVGTFCIDEDDEGNVDTVFREFDLTARQAVQKFGEEQCSVRVRECVQAGGARLNEKIKFLHAIYPRGDDERQRGKLDGENMPVASVYVELDSKHVCRRSGYEEMPVMVSRYLEWGSGLGALYGWSPSFAALPEARQLNFLQKMMDALAEKMAFPPVLAPEELEGEIDASAGGVTYFDKMLEQTMPREWMTQGRYDIGLERVRERQNAVNRAFHVELFQMFTQLDKRMTAREVAERASEKLIQFSPTFSRMTVELFNPLMERLFGILLRAGTFGGVEDIPRSLLQDRGDGMAYLPTPKIIYSSRIALSLRATHGVALQRTLELVMAAAQVAPGTVRQFDWVRAVREDALNNGLPAEYLRPTEDVEAEMQAEAEATAQQRQQQQALMMADAAGKMGRIPGDSPIGRKLGEAMEEAV